MNTQKPKNQSEKKKQNRKTENPNVPLYELWADSVHGEIFAAAKMEPKNAIIILQIISPHETRTKASVKLLSVKVIVLALRKLASLLETFSSLRGPCYNRASDFSKTKPCYLGN